MLERDDAARRTRAWQRERRVAHRRGSGAADQLSSLGGSRRTCSAGNLVIGGIGTSVVRQPQRRPSRRRLTRTPSCSARLRVRWTTAPIRCTGQFALSNIAGDRARITARQRSSARYFQRPDRPARGVDSAGRRYDAGRGRLHARRQGRRQLDVGADGEHAHAGLRGERHRVPVARGLRRGSTPTSLRYFSKPTSWYRTLSSSSARAVPAQLSGARGHGRQAHIGAFGNTPSFGNFRLFVIVSPAAAGRPPAARRARRWCVPGADAERQRTAPTRGAP